MTQKNQVKKLRDQDALLRHIDGLMKDTGKYYILTDEIQLDKEFEDLPTRPQSLFFSLLYCQH